MLKRSTSKLLPLLLVLATMVACQSPPEPSPTNQSVAEANSFSGVWKVEAFTVDIPSMDETMVNAAQQLALSTTYYLAQDSTFKKFDDYLPEGITGTWRVNQKTQELYYDFEFEGRDQSEIYNVESLTEKRLVLTQNVFEGTLRMELTRLRI